jgi:hypothetical protein
MRKDAPHILCFAKANNSIGLAAVQANNGGVGFGRGAGKL